jgi:hypothetical protein
MKKTIIQRLRGAECETKGFYTAILDGLWKPAGNISPVCAPPVRGGGVAMGWTLAWSPPTRPHATAASVRIRTKLYTAAAKVNIQPTWATPRCRVFRSSPTVFIQPKISSTHLRFR